MYHGARFAVVCFSIVVDLLLLCCSRSTSNNEQQIYVYV
nr:MAG TPA: hypothetical protein [Caudoviricetes sp.]